MGIFRKLSTKFGEHKRRVAATSAYTGIAVAVFVAGAWAGSSGALTLGPTPAMTSHAMHAPEANGHEPEESCCDKPMPDGAMGPNMMKHGEMGHDEMGPNMKKHGEMGHDEMGPNMKKHGEMPRDEMGPNKPMKPGMPMHKSDKKCCDKP
ncbi:hypothetical protein NM962_03340 [Mycobacterium sp. SVM_VP21]|nr:hypothetical protein NM962_03340 [Mycobacterium sp. SVM_VP21]